MILYSAVGILTGLMIGYVALALGYVVAKAIKMGSGGMGGRRYQIAAALLTYAAVSIAAVPIGISQYVKARDARAAAHTQHLQRLQSEDAPSADSGEPDSSADPAGTAPAAPPRHPANLSGLLGSLILAGLASPFMELWTNGPSVSSNYRTFHSVLTNRTVASTPIELTKACKNCSAQLVPGVRVCNQLAAARRGCFRAGSGRRVPALLHKRHSGEAKSGRHPLLRGSDSPGGVSPANHPRPRRRDAIAILA
jgi:hypothetical protein